jgi:hypothetical protein
MDDIISDLNKLFIIDANQRQRGASNCGSGGESQTGIKHHLPDMVASKHLRWTVAPKGSQKGYILVDTSLEPSLKPAQLILVGSYLY